MADFTVPPGDPGALRAVASKATSSASRLGDGRRSSVSSASAKVSGALPTMRRGDFHSAASSSTKTLDTVSGSLTTVGGALSAYAGALADAKRDIKAAQSDYDTAEQHWRTAHAAGKDDEAQKFRHQMTVAEKDADDARHDLKSKANTAHSVLAGELHVWVPGGAASPAAAWASAANGILPPHLQLPADQLKDAYKKGKPLKDAITNTVKAGLKGWQAKNLLDWLRAAKIAEKAHEEFQKSATAFLLLRTLDPDMKRYGSKAYFKAFVRFQKSFTENWPADAVRAQKEFGFLRGIIGDTKSLERLRALYPGLTETEIVGNASRFARLMAPLRAASPLFSKVFAPLSIGTGGYDIYKAFTDGSMPTDIRISRGLGGAGGIAAGGATLLVAAGLISNPVGWGIILGGSAAALGAFVYENRKKIWNGIKWTGGKIGDGAKWTGDRISDGWNWSGDRISDGWNWSGDRLSDGAGWAGDRLSDGGKAVKDLGNDIKNAPSDVWHGLGLP